jgi:signal transduction histidine kinase
VATPLMLLTAVTTERRQTEDSLREVAQKLIGAQEEERERIARELRQTQFLSLTCTRKENIVAKILDCRKTSSGQSQSI